MIHSHESYGLLVFITTHTSPSGPKSSMLLHSSLLLQAQVKYAEMRRLDAAALEATQALGCPSCAQAAAAAAASRAGAADSQQQQEPGNVQLYQQLHTPSLWPAAAVATGTAWHQEELTNVTLLLM
jgi:hypothetical protein